MNEPTTTLTGNLVADPELRYTPNGAAVCNFKVAQTPRTFDKQTNEWKDGDALFMACTIWREAAENVSESLTKGMRVIVTGRLKQRSFETKEGDKRTVIEMDVEEVGPTLRYATAKVNRTQRSGGQGGGFNNGRNYDATNGQGGWGSQQADPWATSGQPQNQGFGGTSEEPPF